MSMPRKFTRKRKTQKPEVDPPVPQHEARDDALAKQKAAEQAAKAAQEKARLAHAEKLKQEAAERARSQKAAAEKMRAKLANEAEAKRRAEEQAAKADAATVRKALVRPSTDDLAEEARLQAERDAQGRSAERTRRAAEKAKRAAQLLEEPLPRSEGPDQAKDLVARRARAKVMLSPQTRVDIPPEDHPAAQVDATPEIAAPQRVRWDKLRAFSVDETLLNRNRIITASREDPAHAAFDILRTRLLQALRDRGWHRVAITSPTKNCGKTFTAANLAISLSRQENCRTILMDLDLRNPSLHKVLGASNPGAIGDMLRGKIPPEDHLRRMGKNKIHAGHNIAFGFNDEIEPYASELLQEPGTVEALAELESKFDPDIVLFDLPPALYHDDVMAFRPQFDGVLLVIGGGVTSPKEVKDVERRLGADTPLLGTVLNYAEGANITKYSY